MTLGEQVKMLTTALVEGCALCASGVKLRDDGETHLERMGDSRVILGVTQYRISDCALSVSARAALAATAEPALHPCGDCGALRGAAPCENCDRLDAATAEPAKVEHQSFCATTAYAYCKGRGGPCDCGAAKRDAPTYSADDLRKVARMGYLKGARAEAARGGNPLPACDLDAIIAKAVTR